MRTRGTGAHPHLSIKTFGELRAAGIRTQSVREELRANLLGMLQRGEALFPGIIGYEKTVVPALVNAVLSRHDILLLGLRGQAKTRLLRQLAQFLDEWIPAVAGSPLNEDPFAPILPATRRLLEECGEDTPIAWISRERRFNEKLATPDVSMADLIGDIDPIRASREKLDLSDERAIHFGIVPRTNRGLFLVNELPDLQARIQVGLLNILEERDLQIRGFPLRLPLDMLMLFTANPEDYTNRGRIITPLKDRIASQIVTHYPRSLEVALAITAQEADARRSLEVRLPWFLREAIEEIAVQARASEHVDQTSGVSARLSIAALELVASNVERRVLRTGERQPVPRLIDLYAAVPAVSGKIELVYEGEQEGSARVAARLIGKAVKAVFDRHFPPVHENKKHPRALEPLYSKVQAWFTSGANLELTDHRTDGEERTALSAVDGLKELARKFLHPEDEGEEIAAMGLVLEALHQHSLLSRDGLEGAAVYGDILRKMLEG